MAHGMVDSRELITPWRLAQNKFYGGMTKHGVRDKKIAFPSFCSDSTRHSLWLSVDSNNLFMFKGVQLVSWNSGAWMWVENMAFWYAGLWKVNLEQS
jgi:hypothetical protein